MSEKISPLAGKPVPASLLTNIPRLVTAYYTLVPDPGIKSQRVVFGTSGHRGSAFAAAFNETHILAIAQAVSRVLAEALIPAQLPATPSCAE